MTIDFHKAGVMDEINIRIITVLYLPEKRSFQPVGDRI